MTSVRARSSASRARMDSSSSRWMLTACSLPSRTARSEAASPRGGQVIVLGPLQIGHQRLALGHQLLGGGPVAQGEGAQPQLVAQAPGPDQVPRGEKATQRQAQREGERPGGPDGAPDQPDLEAPE